MGLKKYKLGEYIERSTANNHSLKYKEDMIVGVTSDGVFSSPKGNVNGVDLKPYKDHLIGYHIAKGHSFLFDLKGCSLQCYSL